MSQVFDDYLLRLRALVPARTMVIYTAMIGFYPMMSATSTELPKWLPFVVIALCLVFQVLLEIFTDRENKKKWYIILFSALAFCLYGITQPYVGILGIFEASAAVYVVFTLVMITYVTLIPMLFTEFNR